MGSLFKFLEPGKLIDGDLELVLTEKVPAKSEKKYAPMYEFKMRHTTTGTEIGYFRFRVGDANTILYYPAHIGYEVKEEFRGRRYATRSIRLILLFAKAHGLDKLWIGCQPGNIASRRTCELAGAQLHEIVDIPKEHEMYKEGTRQSCRYWIDLNK